MTTRLRIALLILLILLAALAFFSRGTQAQPPPPFAPSAPSQADDSGFWPEPLDATPPLFFRVYWTAWPHTAHIVWAQASHARTFCLEKLAGINTGHTDFLGCGYTLQGTVNSADLPFTDIEHVNSTPASGDTYILMERHNDGTLLAVYTVRLEAPLFFPLVRR